MSKGCKHGIFAVSGDVVEMTKMKNEERKGCTLLLIALETKFKQMKIAVNRKCNIKSDECIFNQFVEVTHRYYLYSKNKKAG